MVGCLHIASSVLPTAQDAEIVIQQMCLLADHVSAHGLMAQRTDDRCTDGDSGSYFSEAWGKHKCKRMLVAIWMT